MGEETLEYFDLLDIHLYSSSIKRYEDIDLGNLPENLAQQNKRSIKIQILEPDNHSKPKLLRVLIAFGIRFVKPISEESSNEDVNILAHIEAEFSAKYKLAKEPKDDVLRDFIKFHVVHNVWPFWREFAFSASESAHLPKPLIPLMKPDSI
ncbi:MAG: hypothetical protein DRR08_29190 [Candidatus Parabeggiatoa sp. nov. 2]|nr:MAG: hypothetical protein B6247_28815 [Beggiatoa sp. 4572_84]RKZ51558.1 MAG: hypothetical protein DRR08_29190 [Gammaproteobacteria bacterium]